MFQKLTQEQIKELTDMIFSQSKSPRFVELEEIFNNFDADQYAEARACYLDFNNLHLAESAANVILAIEVRALKNLGLMMRRTSDLVVIVGVREDGSYMDPKTCSSTDYMGDKIDIIRSSKSISACLQNFEKYFSMILS